MSLSLFKVIYYQLKPRNFLPLVSYSQDMLRKSIWRLKTEKFPCYSLLPCSFNILVVPWFVAFKGVAWTPHLCTDMKFICRRFKLRYRSSSNSRRGFISLGVRGAVGGRDKIVYIFGTAILLNLYLLLSVHHMLSRHYIRKKETYIELCWIFGYSFWHGNFS